MVILSLSHCWIQLLIFHSCFISSFKFSSTKNILISNLQQAGLSLSNTDNEYLSTDSEEVEADSITNSKDSNNIDSNSNMKKFIPKKFIKFPFDYHQQVTITISDITNLGLGVGRKVLDDGSKWVIHVPYTLPGEEVICQIYQNHNSYSEADLVQVLSPPSPDRVTPLCQYFRTCGGCQYQHISIEGQRRWKQQQVIQLLTRIGGFTFPSSSSSSTSTLIDSSNDFASDASEESIESVVATLIAASPVTSTTIPLVNEVMGTDDVYGYRVKLTPHYDAPKFKDDPVRIGFQMRSYSRILDVTECIIATPEVNVKYASMRQIIQNSFANPVPATATTNTNRPPPKNKNKKGATLLLRDCDEGVVTDQRQIITQTICGVAFKFKAGEFFQNNIFVLPLLVNYVLSKATGHGCTQLIDTYCGCGLFALCGAKSFDKIWGVEVSEQSIEFAKVTARNNQIENAQFLCGSSENIFGLVSQQINLEKRDETVVIIDPPRKGCDEAFLNQLFVFKPKKLIYISCDPSTQARDAKIICETGGYEILEIQPFDLFPQTRHIENVIVFLRKQLIAS